MQGALWVSETIRLTGSVDKLIVDDHEYSIGKLEQLEFEEEDRKARSTPGTPTQVLIREPEPEPDTSNKH